jgi:hypothetical protein
LCNNLLGKIEQNLSRRTLKGLLVLFCLSIQAAEAKPLLDRDFRYYAYCAGEVCNRGFVSSGWASKIGDCKNECPWLYTKLELPKWFERLSPLLFTAKNTKLSSGYYLFYKAGAAPGWLQQCQSEDSNTIFVTPAEDVYYAAERRSGVLKTLANCKFEIFEISWFHYHWWQLKAEGMLQAAILILGLGLLIILAAAWLILIRVSNRTTFSSARKAPPSIS